MNSPAFIGHWGVSYKNTPIAIREQMYLNSDQCIQRCQELAAHPLISELMIFQTCHRFEVFFVCTQQTHPDFINELFGRLSPEPIDTALIHHQTDAVTYLMKVVASLDSIVLGETQVTHQFKQAVRRAERAGTLKTTLRRLADMSLKVAKKIRRQSSLSTGVVSLAHAALKLTSGIYDDLSGCDVAVIGAGRIASLCVDYAGSYPCKTLTIVNRTLAKSTALAHKYPQATAVRLQDLESVIATADIIICCVESPKPLITKHLTDQLMPQRRALKKPYLVICDLAMPRAADPALAEHDEIYMFDIDDLKHTTQQHQQHRIQAAQNSQTLIQAAGEDFMEWHQTRLAYSPLRETSQNIHQLVHKELQRTMRKSEFCDQQTSHLEDLGQAVTRKISSALAQSLDEHSAKIALSELNYHLKSHQAQSSVTKNTHTSTSSLDL